MLKNKNVKIGETEYIINGLDAISAISVLPVFQRVAESFTHIASGRRDMSSPEELRADLEHVLFKSSVLRVVDGVSPNGNPLAKDVTHHSQLPEELKEIGELIQAIGSHVFGYELPEDNEPKKK